MYMMPAYSFSSERMRPSGLVTLMASCAARSTISFRFRLDTWWAISAEKVRFCIISTSSSWKQNQQTLSLIDSLIEASEVKATHSGKYKLHLQVNKNGGL